MIIKRYQEGYFPMSGIDNYQIERFVFSCDFHERHKKSIFELLQGTLTYEYHYSLVSHNPNGEILQMHHTQENKNS